MSECFLFYFRKLVSQLNAGFLITILTINISIFHEASAQSNQIVYWPQLNSQNWTNAYNTSVSAQRARLIVGRQDAQRGFLAVYRGENRIQLLLSATPTAGNRISLSVYVADGKSPSVYKVIGNQNVQPGERPRLLINGVDLISVLDYRIKNNQFPPVERGRLKRFVSSEPGSELLDAIAFIYIRLSEANAGENVNAYISSFGLLRTSLELVAGQHQGIEKLDEFASVAQARLLREACVDGRCVVKGKTFWIHESGFFDVWSNKGGKVGSGSCSISPSVSSASLFDGVAVMLRCQNNSLYGGSNDSCFGACGLGCTGDIYALECCGHDSCVERFGHLACMYSIPEGCEWPCNSLVEAVAAWWRIRSSTVEQ